MHKSCMIFFEKVWYNMIFRYFCTPKIKDTGFKTGLIMRRMIS
jgi:hypothetical protein